MLPKCWRKSSYVPSTRWTFTRRTVPRGAGRSAWQRPVGGAQLATGCVDSGGDGATTAGDRRTDAQCDQHRAEPDRTPEQAADGQKRRLEHQSHPLLGPAAAIGGGKRQQLAGALAELRGHDGTGPDADDRDGREVDRDADDEPMRRLE